MAQKSQPKPYYYAGGRRLPLTPDKEWLVVDAQHLHGEVPEAVQAELRQVAQPLYDGMRLVHREALSPSTTHFLEEAEALYPVFRAAGALVVALPEVRVEEHRPPQQERLREWLEQNPWAARISSQNTRGMVLTPVSGQGTDAVTLANRLTEEIAPEMAQANLLRIVPRPSVVR
jgi:hypothetical protein